MQFLGSKLRSVQAIQDAAASLSPAGVVFEPFAGSSVVSQALAARGHTVWAIDALKSSALFAKTMLGEGRAGGCTELSSLAQALVESLPATRPAMWDGWLDTEDHALRVRDGSALLAMHARLPQIWRDLPIEPPLQQLFEAVACDSQARRVRADGLLSSTYAGTYFSLRQALDLEALRGIIEKQKSRIDLWSYSALLTALCSAASTAVYSPGKHFAQPHRVREGKDLAFHARRALQDRTVDISSAFILAATKIEIHAAESSGRHMTEHRTVETVNSADLANRGVSLVYADPPYTAQQYSRFYHLLETIVEGVPPTLQKVGGKVTRGLYPQGRYLSPFSSRLQSPGAFKNLFAISQKAEASVLLSYSSARSQVSGNARMVELDDIVEWLSSEYGSRNVSVVPFGFQYKQFNSRINEVSGRDEPEYLIIGRHHAG